MPTGQIPSLPTFLPSLSPLLCPFLQCQSQPQQCNGPQWSNGRLLLSMSLRYQLRTVGSTTECVQVCVSVYSHPYSLIRCGNCDCALHLERMQKQTFYLSNICCMFSSFFGASVDKQPKPWQLESGVYTDRDRDMDRERDICRLCTNSAQIDYLPLQMKSKSRLHTDIRTYA